MKRVIEGPILLKVIKIYTEDGKGHPRETPLIFAEMSSANKIPVIPKDIKICANDFVFANGRLPVFLEGVIAESIEKNDGKYKANNVRTQDIPETHAQAE